ncbi:MAG TPA: hypothetical protein VGM81_12380 [Burkholderiaceae bacterium]|jgi:hypothetical protein
MNAWRLRLGVAGSLLAAAATAAAAGVEIYPSGAQVPENLMRIEVRLPKPLYRPLDMTHVTLQDASGHTIAEPFLDLPLPSADGRRIAILMHPGRVKSGVGPNLMVGRALHAGQEVTLVIDDPAIGAPVRKTWQISAFDESRPAAANWTFEPPKAGTRQPLIVHLQAPISAASEGLIAVRGLDGQRLAGRVALADGESSWRFVPAKPWQAGHYGIVAHPDLENPAGNRSCADFEQVQGSQAACTQEQERAFEVMKP